ncbi:MAG: GGDEF domain-containing protein [Stagnimonas sp.]|nr:GGDEF domain-containing protein [Stagnimonas sp.]
MKRIEDSARYQNALERAESGGRTLLADGRSFSLSFDPGIEAEYLEQRSALLLTLRRYVVVLGAFLYACFLLNDALAGARYQHAFNYWMVYGVCVPVNFLMFAATFVERLHPFISRLAAFVAMANAMALSIAGAVNFQSGHAFPLEVLLIQQLYNVFLLGLLTATAANVVLFNLVLFAVPYWLSGMPIDVLIEHSFLLGTSGFLGLIGCYLHEHTDRLNWLRCRVLKDLAERDSLTGLFNHRIFHQRGALLLRQARRDGIPLSIVLIDIDHFKRFNDQYGHPAGDECLRRLATLMWTTTRRPFDVAARLGGEELGLILYGTSAEAAMQRTAALFSAIRNEVFPGGARVTASAGVVQATHGEHDFGDLVARGDESMYRAKAEGRDCIR